MMRTYQWPSTTWHGELAGPSARHSCHEQHVVILFMGFQESLVAVVEAAACCSMVLAAAIVLRQQLSPSAGSQRFFDVVVRPMVIISEAVAIYAQGCHGDIYA